MPRIQFLGTVDEPSTISRVAEAAKAGMDAYLRMRKLAEEREMERKRLGLESRRVGALEESNVIAKERLRNELEGLALRRAQLEEDKRQFNKAYQRAKYEFEEEWKREQTRTAQRLSEKMQDIQKDLRLKQFDLQMKQMELQKVGERLELNVLMNAFNNALDAGDVPVARQIADVLRQRHGINVAIPEDYTKPSEELSLKEKAELAVQRGEPLPFHTWEETKKLAGSYIAPKEYKITPSDVRGARQPVRETLMDWWPWFESRKDRLEKARLKQMGINPETYEYEGRRRGGEKSEAEKVREILGR